MLNIYCWAVVNMEENMKRVGHVSIEWLVRNSPYLWELWEVRMNYSNDNKESRRQQDTVHLSLNWKILIFSVFCLFFVVFVLFFLL